jgi:hypothetical protein
LTSFKINTNIILSKIYKFSYRIGNIFGYSNWSNISYYTASQSPKIPSPLIFVSGNNNTINIKILHAGGIKKIMIFRDYGNLNPPIFSLIYEDIYTNSIIIENKNEIH